MSLEKARVFPGPALDAGAAVRGFAGIPYTVRPVGASPSGADRICIQISSTVAASSSVLPEK